MSEDMVERVAKKLRDADLCDPGVEHWEHRLILKDREAWQTWEWVARFVLNAMREPTEAMEEAALAEPLGQRADTWPAQVWRAMIDAALGKETR